MEGIPALKRIPPVAAVAGRDIGFAVDANPAAESKQVNNLL